jgi:hypothetical protein
MDPRKPGNAPAAQVECVMPLLDLMLIKNNIYSVRQFVEKRRAMARQARALPPGHARNQIRQIAAMLAALVRDKVWLRSHTRQDQESRKQKDPAPSRD